MDEWLTWLAIRLDSAFLTVQIRQEFLAEATAQKDTQVAARTRGRITEASAIAEHWKTSFWREWTDVRDAEFEVRKKYSDYFPPHPP